MSNNIRLKTTPGGGDKNINVSISQDFDFIEILSLKISQDEAYRRFSSDYGVIVGRVIVNNGVGVPNAKVSVFVPVDDDDKLDPEIFGLYPYEFITDKDSEGESYSLLSSSRNGNDDCHVSVGKFSSKRQIQDNPESEEIYCKYYKFTTTTNNSGDYMIFGVPNGSHNVHVETDLSDIGLLSQKPYNMISEGSSPNLFRSPNQFKNAKESSAPMQNKRISPVSVNVIPFWGDKEQFEVGITRLDVDLLINITPTALFMGSAFTDNEKNSINKKCRPRKKLGKMAELITGPGTIEMIRKSKSGSIEFLDIDGGQLIDENGVWCYQVPMNLDYKITSESGELVSSPDSKRGIPTRTDVRFRVGMEVNGSEGKLRRRAKYLIPHNPTSYDESDYTFGTTTKSTSFKTLYWNKIYTVKNHISRVQPNKSVENRNFIGIKNIDDAERNNPFPFNKFDSKGNPLFFIIMAILSTIAFLVWFLNRSIIYALNVFLIVFVKLIWGIKKAVCGLSHILSAKKRAQCRCCGLIDISNGTQGNQDCCDDNSNCDDNDCKEFEAKAIIPYIKMDCGGDKYFLWKAELGQTGVCSDLGTAGGQRRDCQESNPPCISTSVNKFLECNAVQIGDSLNVFKFDFYNDWVNGTLYLFLLKYKYKKNGKEKFCDVDCDSDSLGDYNEDGNSDNNCRKNHIVDNCTKAYPQNENQNAMGNDNMSNSKKTDLLEEGYIKRGVDGELYYSVYSKTNNYKLFATDIVSLGGINENDWQGEPQIYKSLINSTYDLPPNVDEIDEETPSIVDVAGLTGRDNLIFSWAFAWQGTFSITASLDSRQCNNIKRICELGIGLDEDRADENLGPADGLINNKDVDNPFVRGLFTHVNSQTISNNINLVYIDLNNSQDYEDQNYSDFRNVDIKNVWQYDNSYYFYFGLNGNNTALTKLVRDFLTPCIIETDNNFQCVSNTIVNDGIDNLPTGSIIVDIIGGVAPLEYTWDGPEILGVQYPQPSNIINSDSTTTIEGLYSGTYNLSVLDDAGNKTSCSFQVGGPPNVSCDVQFSTPTSSGGSDGEIEISVSNGIAPYTYELYNSVGNLLQSIITPNTTHEFTNLVSGTFDIVVTDSSTIQSGCQQYVVLTEPDLPTISMTGTSITCYGGNDGSAYASILDTNGGNTTIEWSNGVTGTTEIFNLSVGTYDITYTDAIGQVVTSSYSVTQPPSDVVITPGQTPSIDLVGNQYNYNYFMIQTVGTSGPYNPMLSSNPPSIQNGPGYYFQFKINGGLPPYNVKIIDTTTTNFEFVLEELNGLQPSVLNLSQYFYAASISSNSYRIEAEDSNGCTFEIANDISPPSISNSTDQQGNWCKWWGPAYIYVPDPNGGPDIQIPNC